MLAREQPAAEEHREQRVTVAARDVDAAPGLPVGVPLDREAVRGVLRGESEVAGKPARP
jgi:hypothetical protein